MGRIFTGDYSTGDLSQWASVQNVDYNGPGSGYPGGYPVQVLYTGSYPPQVIGEDKDYCARFEVRTGDIPAGMPSGERSEVGGTTGAILAAAETTRWYGFSVKFDPTFPANHSSLGWAVTNQFQDNLLASPTIQWGFNYPDAATGYWSLFQVPQSAPFVYLNNVRLLDVPMNLGNWIDVTMQVHWSPLDANGFVNVWVDGQRQTFLTGGQTFTGRTMIPGASFVHYHEGYYRQASIAPTGIIYHTGFRMADTAASL